MSAHPPCLVTGISGRLHAGQQRRYSPDSLVWFLPPSDKVFEQGGKPAQHASPICLAPWETCQQCRRL